MRKKYVENFVFLLNFCLRGEFNDGEYNLTNLIKTVTVLRFPFFCSIPWLMFMLPNQNIYDKRHLGYYHDHHLHRGVCCTRCSHIRLHNTHIALGSPLDICRWTAAEGSGTFGRSAAFPACGCCGGPSISRTSLAATLPAHGFE